MVTLSGICYLVQTKSEHDVQMMETCIGNADLPFFCRGVRGDLGGATPTSGPSCPTFDSELSA